MKKQLYILLPLCALACSATAQQHFGAGFVIKAGNFNLPQKKQFNPYNSYSVAPGASGTFGGFASYRLGGHFQVSCELLYNFSTLLTKSYNYGYLSSSTMSESTNRTTVHSLVAPIKVHFSPKKNGKLSVSLGTAGNFLLSSLQVTRYQNYLGQTIGAETQNSIRRANGSAYRQILLSAGLQYNRDAFTAVGLEDVGGVRHKINSEDLVIYDIYDPSLYSSYYAGYRANPFRMQSFNLTLHHNILR